MAQSDVAAAVSLELGVDLDQSDVSEIERGVRGVRDFELCALSKVLRVSPHELMGWRSFNG